MTTAHAASSLLGPPGSLRPYWLIAGGALLVRLALLLGSQSMPEGDEAVIGLMARHVLHQGELVWFYWGQHYNGGGALEAYLTALLFAVLGSGALGLKLTACALSLVALALFGRLVRAHLPPTAALLAFAAFAFALPWLQWNLKLRGGYLETVAASIFLGDWLLRRVHSGRCSPWQALGAGLVAGLGYWSLEIITPVLVLYLTALLSLLPRRQLVAALGFALPGFGLGASPLIVSNLLGDFANLRAVYLGGGAAPPLDLGARLMMWLRLFDPEFARTHPDTLPASAWLVIGVYLLALLLTAWTVLKVGWAAAPGLRRQVLREQLRAVWLALGSVLAIGGFFLTVAEPQTRYFLLTVPALSLAVGCGYRALAERGRGATRWIARVLVGGLLLAQLVVHGRYLARPPYVYDLVLQPDGQLKQQRSTPDELDQVVAHLRARGIGHVYASYFLKYRLVFASDEAILASSYGIPPYGYRYPAYEIAVEAAPRYGYVLHRGSWAAARLLLALQAEGAAFDAQIFGNLLVVESRDADLRAAPFAASGPAAAPR